MLWLIAFNKRKKKIYANRCRSSKWCLTLSCVWLLCNPMDCSLPGSSVHEIYPESKTKHFILCYIPRKTDHEFQKCWKNNSASARKISPVSSHHFQMIRPKTETQTCSSDRAMWSWLVTLFSLNLILPSYRA